MTRVLVVGSINMDIIAKSPRLPLPGETLLGHQLQMAPGGKGANQAIAASRLGADTVLAGALGSDYFGNELKHFLATQAIELMLFPVSESATGAALVLVTDDGENSIVVISGANSAITPQHIAPALFRDTDVVLLQGELSDATTIEVIHHARRASATTIVLNLSPFRPSLAAELGAIDYLIVNRLELAQTANVPIETLSASDPAIRKVLRDVGKTVPNVVATLGDRGFLAWLGDKFYGADGYRVPVRDTTGAGDCFCGVFAACLAQGDSPQDSLRTANAAAALAVGQLGAAPSMPTHADISALLASGAPSASSQV
jgi:ribokinase